MKRWLITGVSGGLGQALAAIALGRGDTVFGTVRRNKDQEFFEQQAPGRAFAAIIDLGTGLDRIDHIVDLAVRKMGGIDLLVNNAGYCLLGAIEEVGPAEAAHIMAVNFHAPMALVRAALPSLRASRGRIINISSMAALQGISGLGLYCASKAALSSLTETLDMELRPLGVCASCIEGTALRTGFAGSGLRLAEQRLAEYTGLRDQREAAFAASDRHQPNDPAHIAQVILQLADSADPPVHLALGAGAAAKAGAICSERATEYGGQASQGFSG